MGNKKPGFRIFLCLCCQLFTIGISITTAIPRPKKRKLTIPLQFINHREIRYSLAIPEHIMDTALYDEDETPQLEQLLEEHPRLVQDRTADGQFTLLHLTAAYGNAKATKILINAGAIVEAEDRATRTPLHFAALHGHTAVFDMLLDAGAAIAHPFLPFFTGKSTLQLAAQGGYPEIIQRIIEFYTTKYGQQNTLTMLNRRDKLGYTALFDAIHEKHLTAATMLLHFGASPDIKTYSGATTLHVAAIIGFSSIISPLVRHSSDPAVFVNFQNDKQNTPLHEAAYYAREYQDLEPYILLCSHGANQNIPNEDGLTPANIIIASIEESLLPANTLEQIAERIAPPEIPAPIVPSVPLEIPNPLEGSEILGDEELSPHAHTGCFCWGFCKRKETKHSNRIHPTQSD